MGYINQRQKLLKFQSMMMTMTKKKKRAEKMRRRKSQKQKPRQKRYGFGNISMINLQSGLGIRAKLRRKNIINSFRVLAAKRTVAMTHLCHGFIFVQKGK